MNPLDPRHLSKHDQGMALADSLLEACRPLDPLPRSAHARVKRRLERAAAPKTGRAFPWLQLAVVGITMMICGAAFGIAIDRLVLKRHSSVDGNGAATERSGRASLGKPRKSSGSMRGNDTSANQGLAEKALDGANEASLPAAAEQAKIPIAPPAAGVPLPARPAPAREAEPAAAVTAPALGATPARTGPQAGRAGPAPQARRLALRDLAPTSADLTSPSPQPQSQLAPSIAPAEPLPQPAWPASQPISSPADPPSQAVIPPVPASAPSAQPPARPMAPGEEKLLAVAVRALRADKDAASALVALDQYLANYPYGRLAAEATILRVDAMVALGRRDEALRVLDGLDLGRVPGAIERQLQRAELRASAGRWQDARSDYEVVLSHASERDSRLLERAGSGRALAWQREGNRDQARKAAAEYLRRFPHGPFAAHARLLTEPEGP